MAKLLLMFPGQGSQKVGMAKDFIESYSEAKEMMTLAEEITGMPLLDLALNGPMDTLTETVNLQPAVTAVNMAILAALRSRANLPVAATAGHSLGEFSALAAAGVISASDAFRLVLRRGALMHREATLHGGAMQAIIGLPIDEVDSLVAEARSKGEVSVANHNAELQIIITGETEAVAHAAALATDRGAKAIALKVSGPWHSVLMKAAEQEFVNDIDGVSFGSTQTPVLMNVTAETEVDGNAIQDIMRRQLCSPVRWYDGIRRLAADDITVMAEIGPGSVLTGLAKKILPKGHGVQLFSVNSIKQMDALIEAMA